MSFTNHDTKSIHRKLLNIDKIWTNFEELIPTHLIKSESCQLRINHLTSFPSEYPHFVIVSDFNYHHSLMCYCNKLLLGSSSSYCFYNQKMIHSNHHCKSIGKSISHCCWCCCCINCCCFLIKRNFLGIWCWSHIIIWTQHATRGHMKCRQKTIDSFLH